MIALFIVSLGVFNRLGGEFIPTLEEGDLTVEISMIQGTSLTQVIETFGMAEKILKDKFPEVKQAVTRIGSANTHRSDAYRARRHDAIHDAKGRMDNG